MVFKVFKVNKFIFIFFCNFKFFKNFEQKIKLLKIKKNFSFIILFVFCYFLLSLSPISDADSLDYHLGIPIDIINNERLLLRKDWTHFQLFGLGEFYILFGILCGTTIFGQIVNFYSLISIIYLMIINIKSYKFDDQGYLLLYFLSAPIFLWLVYSSKVYLFPCLLIVFIFRYVFTDKKINDVVLFTLASYLAFILACKVSFFYEVIIIFCIFVYKKINQIKLKQFCYFFLLSGLVILFPFYLTKFIFFNDIIPPF